ncbi:zinc finger protein-domain-containing protein [Plectosphaerella cucumerina]|uniref:Zinc finger protein-domain-containing protein n=1 Tax=Plectosphaerella cucumerina TaxID=40658 RepID=A0A8K0TSP9_9PEZI|nr:zinc finger protein-domain-containing protein [Plectosphaerella cucumerina]
MATTPSHATFLLNSTCALRRIGAGHCGSVWANPEDDAGSVVKREDGGPGRSLSNDYTIHRRLLESLRGFDVSSIESQINIPSNPTFVRQDDPFWDQVLANLPVGYTACNGLISERIPSMPRSSRNLLIEKYCTASLSEKISKDKNNDDCIIRPYLGRRRHNREGASTSRFAAFTLRNYPLNADQMEELGLDMPRYARAMGDALAFMHWKVGIDANDVEFVLAPKRSTMQGTNCTLGGALFPEGCLDEHALWILDFDCCRLITMDDEGIDRCVAAYYRNDPFYPRPGKQDVTDVKTWEAFREQYLSRSGALLLGREEKVTGLPARFIQQLVLRVDDFKSGRHNGQVGR